MTARRRFGNIVCFRDLENATKEALRLFGKNQTEDPVTTVLERGYEDFLKGYDDERGHHHKGYVEGGAAVGGAISRPHKSGGGAGQARFCSPLRAVSATGKMCLQNFDEFVQLRELHESIPADDAKHWRNFNRPTASLTKNSRRCRL